jgi:hypothetical protein
MTAFSVDLAAGGYHTCSVIVDSTTSAAGAVQCWGENGDGQVIGIPTWSAIDTPFVLPVP